MADLSQAGGCVEALGWFSLITGLLVLPASPLLGWLDEGFSPQIAFTGGAICARAAALWLARLPLSNDPG